MRLVFPAGSPAQSAGPQAESIRTMPYLRTLRSRSVFPIAHAFRTWVRNLLRSSEDPMAEPPPVGGQTGATSDPTRNRLLPIFSDSSLIWSAVESISV